MIKEITTTAGNLTEVARALAQGFTIAGIVMSGPYKTYTLVRKPKRRRS